MKSKTILCRTLVALAVMSAMFFTSQLIHAQSENVPDASQASQTAQQQATQPADQNQNQNQDEDQATDQKTFTGVIAKSGDKLVLTDPLTKTSYQLDDQRKAQELVNKNVKVTGILDPSTGTIHVSAINPI